MYLLSHLDITFWYFFYTYLLKKKHKSALKALVRSPESHLLSYPVKYKFYIYAGKSLHKSS